VAAGVGPARTLAAAQLNGKTLVGWNAPSNNHVQAAPFSFGTPFPGPIEVSHGTTQAQGDTSQYEPWVAFDGTSALLVWGDGRGSRGEIYGARISLDGKVQEPLGISLAATSDAEGYPAVAWLGDAFLVSWLVRLPDDTAEVRTARVGASGAVLNAGAVALSASDVFERSPIAVVDGQPLLLAGVYAAGGQGLNLVAVPLTREGVAAGPRQTWTATQGNEHWPTAVEVGSNLLVAWSEADPLTEDRFIAQGLYASDAGLAADAGSPLVPKAGRQHTPDLAGGDDARLLVFEQDYRLRGALLSASGAPLGPSFQLGSDTGAELQPAAAYDGERFLVVWRARIAGQDDVYAREVLADGGMPSPPIAVASSTALEGTPAVTAVGRGRFLVAYEKVDWSAGASTPRVFVRFVTVDPQPLNAACAVPEECASGLCSNSQCAPGTEPPSLLPVHVGCSAGGGPEGAVFLCVLLVRLRARVTAPAGTSGRGCSLNRNLRHLDATQTTTGSHSQARDQEHRLVAAAVPEQQVGEGGRAAVRGAEGAGLELAVAHRSSPGPTGLYSGARWS
jgi:hypothetical protein